jgi:uncharacterized protein YndB with AHSA1/START domain
MNEFPPVIVERELDAPIETVFQAWTDPTRLIHWFKSSSDTRVVSAEVDLRVGGKYKITLGEDHEPWLLFGTYSEVEEPNLIEFTWMWEEATMELRETLVRVELEPAGEKTKLKLTHSRFSNEKSFQAHGAGWDAVLSTLASYLEG